MANLGPMELIIILVIVLLVFGVGRISDVAGELGSGIRAFQEGLKGESQKSNSENNGEAAENRQA